MNNSFEVINKVLEKWDPIGVGENIAIDEYRAYIPSIRKVIEDRQKLRSCLEDILTNKLGLGYNPNDDQHLLDLLSVCDQLMEVYRTNLS